MGLVTGLAQLPAGDKFLWSGHMGNFSPVDWDIFQETKPKWWNVNLYALWTLASYKANLHTSGQSGNTFKTKNMPFFSTMLRT